MTVKRIDTLGCHPLVLLKKLASIGGVEILKEEKHVYDGTEYPYRIVAKVRDGLYLEAYDGLYEQATTAAMLPRMLEAIAFSGTPCTSSVTPARVLKMEALESDRTMQCVPIGNNTTFHRFGIFRESNLSLPVAAPSVLVTTYGIGKTDSSAGFATWLFSGQLSGVSVALKAMGTGPVAGTGVVVKRSSNFAHYYPNKAFSGGQSAEFFGDDASFACMASSAYPNFTLPCDGGAVVFLGTAWCTNAMITGAPLVVSGAVVRVGSGGGEGGLVSPGEWVGFPIFAQAISGDSGLLFLNPGGGDFSGTMFLSTAKVASGSGTERPVVYRAVPTMYHTGISAESEHANVVGTATNPSATVKTSLFYSSPPILNDEGVGGPVASEVLAYTATEICGAIQGMLAIPDQTPIGTAGWLDGKKYSVLTKGRMFQVG